MWRKLFAGHVSERCGYLVVDDKAELALEIIRKFESSTTSKFISANDHNATRFGRTEDGEFKDYRDATSFALQHDLDGETVRSLLKERFCVENNRIIRVRNRKGSLIPIGSNMKPNSPESPYILEVVKLHQTVKPSHRAVKMSTYNDTLKKKLDSILHRIECLEKATPDLHLKRNAQIKVEVEDLNHKLSFLNKRFEQADRSSWKGMFRKCPLW